MRSTRVTVLAIIGLLTVTAAAAAAPPQGPGSLDPSFGTGGLAAIEMDSTPIVQFDPSADLVLDSEERAIVAGTVGTISSQIGLARLTPGGQLDPSFGGDGKVLGPIGGARAVAVDASDGVLVAGYAQPFAGAAVLRYNADGSLDDGGAQDGTPGDAFGTGGGAPAGMTSVARLAVRPPDGRIVVAGATGGSLVVRRLTASGAVDADFGVSGTVTVPISGAAQVDVMRVAFDDQGRILVAMGVWQPPSTHAVTARLTSGGTLDPSFGSGGLVDLPGMSSKDLVVQGSRSIQLGFSSMGLATGRRLLENGSGDGAFGVGGVLPNLHHPLTLAPGYMTDQRVDWVAGARMADGRLMTAGSGFGAATPSTDPPTVEGQVGLARFTADGAADTTFGTCGLAQAPAKIAGARGSSAIRVAAQSDGRTVVLVREETPIPTPALPVTFVVARLLGGSGPATPEVAPATLPATAVTSTEATLNGRIDPAGAEYLNYEFQISEDSSYGDGLGVEDLAPTGVTNVATTVTDLEPATTYRFRLVALSVCGRWIAGEERTFTTPPRPAPVGPVPGAGVLPQPSAGVPTAAPLGLTLRLRPGQTLGRAHAKGLGIAAACTRACALDAQLLVDRAAARKLRLRIPGTAKLLRVGRGTGTAAADGRTLITVRLTPAAASRLSGVRSATFRLRVTARSGAERRTVERRLVLTRAKATLAVRGADR